MDAGPDASRADTLSWRHPKTAWAMPDELHSGAAPVAFRQAPTVTVVCPSQKPCRDRHPMRRLFGVRALSLSPGEQPIIKLPGGIPGISQSVFRIDLRFPGAAPAFKIRYRERPREHKRSWPRGRNSAAEPVPVSDWIACHALLNVPMQRVRLLRTLNFSSPLRPVNRASANTECEPAPPPSTTGSFPPLDRSIREGPRLFSCSMNWARFSCSIEADVGRPGQALRNSNCPEITNTWR